MLSNPLSALLAALIAIMHAVQIVILAALPLLTAVSAKPSCPPPPEQLQLPNATASGYLHIDDKGSRLFFLYYEASPAVDSGSAGRASPVPITLWLQGGPGCASLFGAFYELGPELVGADLSLHPNPGSWNRKSALLFIDQPVGAGFSVPGKGREIPEDEITLAADLYAALQAFFQRYPHLQPRTLVIAGESYAGKYVPSIGHFILQQATQLGGSRSRGLLSTSTGSTGGRTSTGASTGSIGSSTSSGSSTGAPVHHRDVPPHLLASRPLLLEPPLFDLRALAIGNGLTDPAVQVMAHADTAYFMGYIDPLQRLKAMAIQLEVVQLIAADQSVDPAALAAERWEEAHNLRSSLLEHIRHSAGAATLLDMRRYEDYDAGKLVDCYLNLPEVKEAIGADPSLHFVSCSDEVGQALGPDVMKTVVHLIPDLLAAYPLLLYQGMWDAQDGAASCEAWIYGLEWEGRSNFTGAKRHILRAKDLEVVEGREHREQRQDAAASFGKAAEGHSTATGSSGRISSGVATAVAQKSGSQAGPRLKLGRGEGASQPAHHQRQLQGAGSTGGSSHRLHLPSLVQKQQQQHSWMHGEQQQQSGWHERLDSDSNLGKKRDASGQRVVAYFKQGGGLMHVVLTEAGHMVPRDAPTTGQYMVERWLEAALQLER